MAPGRGSFVRDNAFLVAAVSLPLVIVIFFAAAAAIPRWTVPPPRYDLVLRAAGPYTPDRRIFVDFAVRDGRVEATVRPLPANAYAQPAVLLLFDHATMSVRELPLDLPADPAEGDPPRTIVVEALAGRRVVADAKAPDGYGIESRPRRGPGLVGELFGMDRYDVNASLVNRGRVIPLALQAPDRYQSPVSVVGWIVDDGAR